MDIEGVADVSFQGQDRNGNDVYLQPDGTYVRHKMKTKSQQSEVLTGEELEEFLAFQKQEQTTDEGIIINDPEASGRIDAFLAGMSNNEDYKTRWLAEKRFPDLVEQGVDPMQFYFVDGDGDLSYKDPKDG